MSFLHRYRRGFLTSLLVCSMVLVAASGGSAAAGSRSSSASGSRMGAVVALAGTHALGAPGVRVVTVLSGVHAEIVTGSPQAVASLAGRPGVLGVRSDTRITLDSQDFTPGGSVSAAQGLAAPAGQPGAGAGVTVALVDTGVSDTEILNRASGRLVDAVDTSPLVDLQPPVTSGSFTDGYGHGTFMASLIAGGPSADSSAPVGVAPGATVDVVKVAKNDGTTSLSAVLAGLNWVALHAGSVQVANLALGLPTGGHWGADPLNLATEWVRDAGVLVVAAAGNVAHEVADPGFDPRNLTVGAADTTQDHVSVAGFSGRGVIAGVEKPDVVASGVGVLGVLPDDSMIAQQNPGALQPNGLWRGSGTSEATAVTSGVAALYYAGHPDAGPLDAKTAIRTSATDMHGPGAGAGLLQVVDNASSSDDPPGHGNGAGRAHRGSAGSGESNFNQVAWVSTPWAAASWAAASWAAASWARAASWAGNNWQAASWASAWWQAASWAAASWAAASWAAASWAAASWAAASWAAASWAAESWGDGDGR